MNNFLRLLSYVKNYSGAAILNIIFNIFAVIFSVVSVIMLIPFMELLFDLKTPVPVKPEFSMSPQVAIDYFYFQLGYYMNEFGKEEALIYFCLVVIVVFFLKHPRISSSLALLGIVASLASSVLLFMSHTGHHAQLPHEISFPWIQIPGLSIDFGFLIDPLSLVMLLIVTGAGW